jgi:hypothetical protein
MIASASAVIRIWYLQNTYWACWCSGNSLEFHLRGSRFIPLPDYRLYWDGFLQSLEMNARACLKIPSCSASSSYLGFEVPTTLTVFWDVTPCSLMKSLSKFRRNIMPLSSVMKINLSRKHAITSNKHAACCLLSCCFGLLFDHEDGGSTFLRNIGKLLPDYIESELRRSFNFFRCYGHTTNSVK